MPLDEFRARAEALVKLAKPIARERGPRQDYGDGDPCPTHPKHGKMYTSDRVQYCPHHEHDFPTPPAKGRTRCFWPLYIKPADLLPDIDITGLEA